MSSKEESNRDNRKVDGQRIGGQGDKEISFPTTWPSYKTESSGDVW